MREAAADLPGQPGLALRAAADHHRVGAGLRQRLARILERQDVAVDDERDRDRIPDRANRAQSACALVELAARAPVHGDQLDAGSFRALRQFGALIEL